MANLSEYLVGIRIYDKEEDEFYTITSAYKSDNVTGIEMKSDCHKTLCIKLADLLDKEFIRHDPEI